MSILRLLANNRNNHRCLWFDQMTTLMMTMMMLWLWCGHKTLNYILAIDIICCHLCLNQTNVFRTVFCFVYFALNLNRLSSFDLKTYFRLFVCLFALCTAFFSVSTFKFLTMMLAHQFLSINIQTPFFGLYSNSAAVMLNWQNL